MNWGKSIVLYFVIFVSFIGILAYKMAVSKVDLVKPNYYQKEIDYQNEIDRNRNSAIFKSIKAIHYSPELARVTIDFPTDVKSGEVVFYRPSDKNLDIAIALKNAKHFEYVTKALKPGLWKVRTVWSDGTLEYYIENEFTIK